MALADICLGVNDTNASFEFQRGNVGIVQDMRLVVSGRMTYELTLVPPSPAQVQSGVAFGQNKSLTGTLPAGIPRSRLVNHA